MDIVPPGRHDWPVTDALPPAAPQTRYMLTYLTDEWEWDADLTAETTEQAMAAARAALLVMVEEEKPKLACVTLIQAGKKIGVWDWVEKQPYWTWF